MRFLLPLEAIRSLNALLPHCQRRRKPDDRDVRLGPPPEEEPEEHGTVSVYRSEI